MIVKEQVALVSGGASGLGEATARHLASLGARVAILDFDIDKANSVAAEIGGLAIKTDVSDEKSVHQAVAAIEAKFGAPRMVISCAGIAHGARIVGREGKPSFELFQRTINVNLLGSYYVMTHAAARMMELEPLSDGERGVIVNTSSVAYEDGQLGQSAYAASKGAIASMCLPAAREFARAGIRVMAIAPGLFKTPMMEGLPEEVTDKITADIPFPARLGHPSEYALMAEHIITNRFLNGTTIRLDGAVRLPPR